MSAPRTLPATAPARGRESAARDRLHEILDAHFDPRWGSAYWLRRQRELGLDVRRDVQVEEDLECLGPMDPAALLENSVWDLVPRRYHPDAAELVIVETGGTLGAPRRTAYLEEEFREAFVAPFLSVAADFGFRRGARWAWIGPGGPHAVGKAAREVCRAMGSADPFSVDFDPRWFRAQAPGSLGRLRYLEHVLEQATTLLEREPVEVIFSTPPVLLELGARLPRSVRERIEALHLGGLPLERAAGASLKERFPGASCLSGYGNSLFGMCPQVARDVAMPIYFPHGERLRLRVAELENAGKLPRPVDYGQRGRVLGTRLDRSFLIVNLVERDTAVRRRPPRGRRGDGFTADGLEDPRPCEAVPRDRLGIY